MKTDLIRDTERYARRIARLDAKRSPLKFTHLQPRTEEERARWFGRAPTPLEKPVWRASSPF